jgi:hypothetical protein
MRSLNPFTSVVYGKMHTLMTLSAATGIPKWRLERYSQGRRTLTEEELGLVAETLGISRSDIPTPRIEWDVRADIAGNGKGN